MVRKRVLRPERLRRVPEQFSWIDQRLVSEHYTERCDCQALALYLVLATVADHQGLSYYGDAPLSRLISLTEIQMRAARAVLIGAGLIAYEAPLYQVLSLAPPTSSTPPQSGLQPIQARLAALATAQRQTRTA